MYGRELAHKTTSLYETCRRMFGTNTYISNNIVLGDERAAAVYGWSTHSLKGIVAEAGAMLEKSQSEADVSGLSTIQVLSLF